MGVSGLLMAWSGLGGLSVDCFVKGPFSDSSLWCGGVAGGGRFSIRGRMGFSI